MFQGVFYSSKKAAGSDSVGTMKTPEIKPQWGQSGGSTLLQQHVSVYFAMLLSKSQQLSHWPTAGQHESTVTLEVSFTCMYVLFTFATLVSVDTGYIRKKIRLQVKPLEFKPAATIFTNEHFFLFFIILRKTVNTKPDMWRQKHKNQTC